MAQKKYASLSTLQTFLDNLKNLFATQTTVEELSADVAYINSEDNENITDVETGGTTNVTVDSALSETSENPVQNKVITEKINEVETAIADKQPKTLVVTISMDESGNLIADYTSKQIADHVASGGDVVAYSPDGDKLQSAAGDETEWCFDCSAILPEEVRRSIYYVSDDGSVFVNGFYYDPKAIPLPKTAQVGQMFRVSEVNGDGRVTKVEAVDMPTGGDSVQPDWNQNDATAPDYVKNRLAWTDDPVETVLFDGIVVNDDSIDIELIVGQEYVVTLDGTEYVLTAWDDGDGSVVIGSESLWWGDEYVSTEPPFVLGVYSDGAWFYTINEGDEHTLRVVSNIVEVHKIDEKYLPENKFATYVPYASVVYPLFDIFNAYGFRPASYYTTDGYEATDIPKEIFYEVRRMIGEIIKGKAYFVGTVFGFDCNYNGTNDEHDGFYIRFYNIDASKDLSGNAVWVIENRQQTYYYDADEDTVYVQSERLEKHL